MNFGPDVCPGLSREMGWTVVQSAKPACSLLNHKTRPPRKQRMETVSEREVRRAKQETKKA